jgi:hypothetical protein
VATLRPNPAHARIKGATLREFAVWYERRRGKEARVALGESLPSALRDLVWPDREGLGLAGTEWYPVSLAHHLLDSAAVTIGPEMPRLLREATEHSVSRLTRGVYATFFRMIASPALYSKHVQRTWRLVHDTGTRRMVFLEPETLESTIEDWPGHHPWLCVITTETVRAVFLAMGCKDVRVDRTACVGRAASRGAASCRALVRFRT